MGENEKPRHRFVNWSGGLHTADEAHLIGDNEYSAGTNIELKSGVPQSRAGATKETDFEFDAACYGMGEYLYYAVDGTLSRYLLWMEGTNLRAALWNGSAWIEVASGTAIGAMTTGKWTSITSFKNKALITNGEDEPREFDIDESATASFALGLRAPQRKLLICDFATTPADDTEVAQAYTYTNGGGASIVSGVAGVASWETEFNKKDLIGNTTCLKMTTTTQATTVSAAIGFDTALDLTAFHDGTASDDLDVLVFSFFLVAGGWNYFDNLTIEIDVDNGNFTDKYITREISPTELDAQDWGGFHGGRYQIRIPKEKFDAYRYTGSRTNWKIDWANVKAIRFKITKATSQATPILALTAYIDYLRMEESGPIPVPTEKLIDSMDIQDVWTRLASHTGDVENELSDPKPTYGTACKRINFESGLWTGIQRTFGTPKDLSQWGPGYPVKPTDCIALDVYVKANSGDGITGGLFTLRCYSGTKRVGGTKSQEDGTDEINGYTPLRNPMPGVIIPNQWCTIYWPIALMRDTNTTVNQILSEFFNTTHTDSSTDMNDTDQDVSGGWTPEEVLQKVTKIRIDFAMIATSPTYMYVDNLRLVPFPITKPIANFAGISHEFEIDVAGIFNKFIDLVNPRLAIVEKGLEWLSTIFPQTRNVQLMLGEQWTFSGTAEAGFDLENKHSIWSSLRMKIDPGSVAVASLVFNTASMLGSTNTYLDLTEYGKDRDLSGSPFRARFQNLAADPTKYFDGVVADDADIIELRVMIDRISAIEKFQIIFTCLDDGNYFLYDVKPEDYGYKRKEPRIHETGSEFFDKYGDIITAASFFVPYAGPLGLPFVVDNNMPEIENKGWVLDFQQGDHVWHKLQIRKSDFIRYGDAATSGWQNIKQVQLAVYAIKLVGCTIWFDKMLMRNEGALDGDYYYKAVYRAKNIQSAPTPISPVVQARGSDVIVHSIPASPDPRVLYKDLYRMGGSDNIFRYLTTIENDDTEFYDNIQDKDLGIVLDPDFNDPPIAQYGAAHANRYFLARTKARVTRIHYSRPFVPGAFPRNNHVDIEPGAYGGITGMISREDDLVVFKDNAIYRLTEFSNPADPTKSIFQWSGIDKTIGCDAPRSIVSRNNIIYWIWRNRPYRLIGNQVDSLFGDNVEDLFDYADENACAVYNNDKVLFSVKSASGSSTNDQLVSFNTKYQKWESVFSGTGWAINALVSDFLGSLWGGAAAQVSSKYHIWKMFDGLTDDGNNIAASVTTKNVPGFEKRIDGYDVWETSIKNGSVADSLTIQPIIDFQNGAADNFAFTETTRPQTKRIHLREEDIGSFIGFKVSCSTSTGIWKLIMIAAQLAAKTDLP